MPIGPFRRSRFSGVKMSWTRPFPFFVWKRPLYVMIPAESWPLCWMARSPWERSRTISAFPYSPMTPHISSYYKPILAFRPCRLEFLRSCGGGSDLPHDDPGRGVGDPGGFPYRGAGAEGARGGSYNRGAGPAGIEDPPG